MAKDALRTGAMKRIVRDNGLALAAFGLFAIFFVGQSVAGHREYNACAA